MAQQSKATFATNACHNRARAYFAHTQHTHAHSLQMQQQHWRRSAERLLLLHLPPALKALCARATVSQTTFNLHFVRLPSGALQLHSRLRARALHPVQRTRRGLSEVQTSRGVSQSGGGCGAFVKTCKSQRLENTKLKERVSCKRKSCTLTTTTRKTALPASYSQSVVGGSGCMSVRCRVLKAASCYALKCSLINTRAQL